MDIIEHVFLPYKIWKIHKKKKKNVSSHEIWKTHLKFIIINYLKWMQSTVRNNGYDSI